MKRHNEEIQLNKVAWARKPSLRKVYNSFHEAIRRRLKYIPNKLIVELGSGIGSIKTVIPECVTTDIFSNPWLDRQENAYSLSFTNDSVGCLILFDVWHHLEYPGTAMREFWRVLVEGGRVILFEPAISVFGTLIYGSFLHAEPLGLGQPIHWEAPVNFDPTRAPYFAAQSRAARIFQRREITQWSLEWNLLAVEEIVSFAYVLSGGFGRPQLYPQSMLPAVECLDRLLARYPKIFATRLLIQLEKKISNA